MANHISYYCSREDTRSRLLRTGFAIAVFLVAATARGQASWSPAEITPAAPTPDDEIAAAFTTPGACGDPAPGTLAGDVIRLELDVAGCAVLPGFEGIAIGSFGPLAAGTYTLEIYFTRAGFVPELRSTQTFAVNAVSAPALSRAMTLALLVALAVAAIFALRNIYA